RPRVDWRAARVIDVARQGFFTVSRQQPIAHFLRQSGKMKKVRLIKPDCSSSPGMTLDHLAALSRTKLILANPLQLYPGIPTIIFNCRSARRLKNLPPGQV